MPKNRHLPDLRPLLSLQPHDHDNTSKHDCNAVRGKTLRPEIGLRGIFPMVRRCCATVKCAQEQDIHAG